MAGNVLQLELPVRDAASLRLDLERLVGAPVELAVTDNGSTMLSFRPATLCQPIRLRLHRMFLCAGPDVLEALAAWTVGRRSRNAGPLIDRFIADHQHWVRRRPIRRATLHSRGFHHDLQRYYEEVNRDEFEDGIDTPITWGRLPATRRRRSIRLGSFSADDNLIRIHPHLDQPCVPDFFVRYIVFHEMLHAHLGIDVGPSGRRRIHTREFNRRERLYCDYARAIAWHDDPANLARVLRPAKKSA